MTTTKIEVRECDRCKKRQEMPEPQSSYEWGLLFSRQINGPAAIKKSDSARLEDVCKDLCPNCLKSLMDWWKAGGPTRL